MSESRPPYAWLAIPGVILILAATSYFGWKALGEAEPERKGAGAAEQPPSTVIVRPAETREIVETLEVTGTLRAVRRSRVASLESSAIESMDIDEGDRLEKDAVIARLDSRRLDAQFQEAKATLTAAEADLAQREAERERAVRDEEMMRGLWDERAVSEREYLDSLREMKVAEARENASAEAIEAARQRLDLLELRRGDLAIRAPFAGEVVARHAEVGEWLNAGDPVITLLATGEVEAWLQLPERHAGLLREIRPGAVRMSVPGRSAPVRADRLSIVPDVEGRSRRFNLIAHIPDPEVTLTPGMSVRATVPIGAPEPRTVISSDGVLNSYAGTYVFVPDPSGDGPPVAKRVDVTVEFERAGEAILAPGGLEAGAEVIVEGNERLFPGTPLDPHPWSETRGSASAGNPSTPEDS